MSRASTVTEIVLTVLRTTPGVVPGAMPWLTMREIIDRAADRGETISLNAVASALANVESGALYVDRSRRPFRYRLRVLQ